MAEHRISVVLLDVVRKGPGRPEWSITSGKVENKYRIVLRTGEPGQAPEQEVITRSTYDYKEKTELPPRSCSEMFASCAPIATYDIEGKGGRGRASATSSAQKTSIRRGAQLANSGGAS